MCLCAWGGGGGGGGGGVGGLKVAFTDVTVLVVFVFKVLQKMF